MTKPGIHLVCDCCGFAKAFSDAEEAFAAGWDGPPDFSGYIACDLCPGALIVLGQTKRHEAGHQTWISDGRPQLAP